LRKGIEKEVRYLLLEKGPMKAWEIAEALGYKTKEVWPGAKSAGRFNIKELEDKGLVVYDEETHTWRWID